MENIIVNIDRNTRGAVLVENMCIYNKILLAKYLVITYNYIEYLHALFQPTFL